MNQAGNFEDLQGFLPKLKGMHILLFDPDKSALSHTKSMLKQAFYTVIASGEQSMALKMLADNAELIDLIMIDDKPQEMDCAAFIRKIKEVKETIPIILLSSREVYLSASLIQIGVCHVVSKPISNGEVKSLWKQTNGWRTEVYITVQPTIEDKARRALTLQSDPIGKGKAALSFGLNASLYGDKYNNKKRHEIYDTSYDEQDDDDDGGEFGNGRKKSRVYTAKLHKKCMDIINKKADYPVRISRRPTFAASLTPIMRTILHQKVNAEERFNKSSNILGVQTLRANRSDTINLRSDVSNKIHYPSKNLGFGFPMNQVLESTPPVIQDTTQRIILSPSGSSTHVSGKGIATNSNITGLKRAMSNDLTKFSHIVHAQSSFLATNGEYMRKKQLSESSLLNTSSTEFLPSISNNNISLSNPAGIINVEENALSGFSFGDPAIYEQAQAETVFESAGVFQEKEQQQENPVSFKFNEVSMDEFLEGLLDKPEGSASSSTTLSSSMFQGFETSATDHSQRSTSNLGSFTENGSFLPEPMNVDDPFVQLNNFGDGMSPSEDIFNEIARQFSFEGMF